MENHISSGILIGSLLLMLSCGQGEEIRQYSIQQGEFQASLTETGELQAVVAKHIIMPFLGWKYGYRNKITGMVEHGSDVEEGDSVFTLDPSSVMKFLVETENNLELEKAKLNKLLVENSNKDKKLRAQLRHQEANYNMNKLQLEKSQFDSERNKIIQELEFQKAEISLNKIKRSIEYNVQIAEYGRLIQLTRVQQMVNDIENANRALRRLTLYSPNKGILQIAYNRRTRQLYKIGDESYPNRSLASIPDLRRMKATSSVNEVDIGKIKIGQKVIVRLDAFPDLEFNGEISSIGKLSHSKTRESNIKIFDLEVLIEENDNKTMKPGMTVSCEIIYSEFEEVLYVSNDCISREKGQYLVQLTRKGDVIKIPVDIGPQNNSHTVIYGDIEKGQKVVPVSSLILGP
ncbi:MAG TPA: HlyD family efflux transporter periplasmic adaptor subunit [Bacteroides sp.]|nr:HlyD family efflux transporter periplasmic adaptor subunit [Bacteroides sp.]